MSVLKEIRGCNRRQERFWERSFGSVRRWPQCPDSELLENWLLWGVRSDNVSMWASQITVFGSSNSKGTFLAPSALASRMLRSFAFRCRSEARSYWRAEGGPHRRRGGQWRCHFPPLKPPG